MRLPHAFAAFGRLVLCRSNGVMLSSVNEVVNGLTLDEISALEELDRGSIRRSIPSTEAKSLLKLGLAEVSFGRLALTPAGRHVLVYLHDNMRNVRIA